MGTFTYDDGVQNTMVLWDPETGPVDGGRHEMINETNAQDVWQYLAGLCQARPNGPETGPVGAAAPPANGVPC